MLVNFRLADFIFEKYQAKFVAAFAFKLDIQNGCSNTIKSTDVSKTVQDHLLF